MHHMPKGQKVRVITPQQDEVIHKCWQHNGYGHHAQKRAAELTGLTESVCFRRALQLGLVFTRERYRWTEPELQCVEQHCHLALDTIQKRLRLVSPAGVKRTRAAIAGQIHSQRFRTNLDGMNHGPLADALGISVQRLRGYRDEHLIAGQRLESLREACGYVEEIVDEHRHWFYHNDDIVRFLFSCHGQLDLAKVNQLWLMGLLEPYITIFQPEVKEAPVREREAQLRKRIEVLDGLLAEADRPPEKRRRGRPTKAESTKLSSIPFRPAARQGLLSDEAIAAIRAGKSRARRGKDISSGDPASLPSSSVTGMILQPSGNRSGSERVENAEGR